MNIQFEPKHPGTGIEQGGQISTGGVRTTAYGAGDTRSTNGISLDISGFVKDNNAYAGQGKTAEDVMSEMGATDVATMQNYMTVMSNTLSGEDYSELMKDGYQTGQMPVGETVTVVDEIKAVMAEAGIVIEGYNDQLDKDTLREITGNEAYAQAIASGFEKYQIDPTEQNVKDTIREMEKLSEVSELSDNAKKYMLINRLSITSDHLFKAAFSGGSGALKQGEGYFAESSDGYYGKKADKVDVELIRGQMEKIISEAGLLPDEKTMEEAAWVVENGIALTPDSIRQLHTINSLSFPIDLQTIADASARAVSDGIRPAGADLATDETLLEQAVRIKEETESVTDEVLKAAVYENKSIRLATLYTQEEMSVTLSAEQEKSFITARRQLEEVRLHMTVGANYRLLKAGIRIDTLSMERTVEALKSQEEAFGKLLFAKQPEPSGAYRLWQETDLKVAQLKLMPAALVGVVSKESATINLVHETGMILKDRYDRAGESYEALMTAPRRDLGDSITKAFQNVDDILTDLKDELTDENRRAVRILGYNRMEITKESVQQIREADTYLQQILSAMTPGRTLQMIREGINPLETSLPEIKEYLSQIEESDTQKQEKYSKFLYELEQDHAITESEREAYIGIYRMLHQIEKTKGAAVGTVVHNGQEMSFSNLLEAVRTRKTAGINLTASDETGFLKESASYRNSISEQINAYFEAFSTKEGEEAFLKQNLEDMRENLQVSPEILEELLANGQSVTPDHLAAQKELSRHRGTLYKELDGLDGKQVLKEKYTKLLESFTDADKAMEAYEEVTVAAKEVIEDAMEGSDAKFIDVKSMIMSYKQISFAANLAREENYEVPMTLDGELTSVNIRIVHNRGEKGEVSASFENAAYGKVQARFSLTKSDKISGFVVTNRQDGLRELKNRNGILCSNILKESGKEADVNYVWQDKEISGVYSKSEKDENVSTEVLYRIAKGFLQTYSDALE